MLTVILLATYNGAGYLQEQLDSIVGQTYPHWLLFVKDDGSTDGTVDILHRYHERYPEKVLFLGRSAHNQGPARMYSSLIQYVLEREQELQLKDYCIAFCDQDDIWHSDKLRLTVDCLQAQRSDGALPPLLIHSELSVVDEHGNTIAPRFSAYQGVMPERNDFIPLLVHNVVTGCTAVITPPLARACTPIPSTAYMHDWWFALVASLIGRILYIDEPLVAYRQHGGNTLGAREFKPQSKFKMISGFVAPDADKALLKVARQARWIHAHPPCRLTSTQIIACWLASALVERRSMVLRAMAFKLLKHLGAYEARRRGRALA